MYLKNLEFLKNKKNLLAFSGGTDSSALFYLLQNNNIDFDVVMVNYNTRENSDKEFSFGKKLCLQYSKKFFGKSVKIEGSNFEKKARDIRHDFFKEVLRTEGYENLITGHNLNDKTEWLFMQLTRGAGIRELFGMNPIERLDSYNIVRPLISTSKKDILKYLEGKEYYFDESNKDTKYTRNKFREEYVNKLMEEFSEGISKTFDILESEIEKVDLNFLRKEKEFFVLTYEDKDKEVTVNKALKLFGHVMTSGERKIFSEREELTFGMKGRNFVCSLYNSKIFIIPYLENVSIRKDKKDMLRKKRVPQKLRPFLQNYEEYC